LTGALAQGKNSPNELVKAMEDLSIQGKEIEILKAQLKTLQDHKLQIDSSYVHSCRKITGSLKRLNS